VFEQGPWEQKFPTVAASWRRAWTHVIPFFEILNHLPVWRFLPFTFETLVGKRVSIERRESRGEARFVYLYNKKKQIAAKTFQYHPVSTNQRNPPD
jgi:hypothetical protein